MWEGCYRWHIFIQLNVELLEINDQSRVIYSRWSPGHVCPGFFGTLRIMEYFRMALENQGILFWNFDGIPELPRAILRWLWWLKTGRSPLELFSTMWLGPFIFQVSPLGDISMIPSYGIWGYMLHVEQISCVITNRGTSVIHPIQLSFAVVEVICLCKKLFVITQWCVREDNDFID